jgi:hypothetical protein
MSIDPLGIWVADANDPQTWNMYSYGRNNPVTNTDSTGYDCVFFDDSGSEINDDDQHLTSGDCTKQGGDWINGKVDSATYDAKSDTWTFKSSDAAGTYTTTANAPGTESDGTTCSANCDTSYSGQQNSSSQPESSMTFYPIGGKSKQGQAPSNPTTTAPPPQQRFWQYVRHGTFCTDTINAAKKAGWIGGGAFVVGTGLDATGVAIPVGVALQEYGTSVMAYASALSGTAAVAMAIGACH